MAAKVKEEDRPKPSGAIETVLSGATFAFLALFMTN